MGRTARGKEGRGRALLLLMPEELGFLKYLKEAKVRGRRGGRGGAGARICHGGQVQGDMPWRAVGVARALFNYSFQYAYVKGGSGARGL